MALITKCIRSCVKGHPISDGIRTSYNFLRILPRSASASNPHQPGDQGQERRISSTKSDNGSSGKLNSSPSEASSKQMSGINLMTMARKLVQRKPRYIPITHQELLKNYLLSGTIERLEIVQPRNSFPQARVILTPSNSVPGTFTEFPPRIPVVTIGTVDSLLRSLDRVQNNLGLAEEDRVSVVFESISTNGSFKIVKLLIFGTVAFIVLVGTKNLVVSEPLTIESLRGLLSPIHQAVVFDKSDTLDDLVGSDDFAEETEKVESNDSDADVVNSMVGQLFKPEEIKVSFSDVVGCEEAKMEILEIVNFLKNPKLYKSLGAKMPKGAILDGASGTGKTLLAKATAAEAGVPLIFATGSDIDKEKENFQNLLNYAKENAPCILFVDEMDTIVDYTAMLVEMDNYDSTDGVVILGATRDGLDSAMLKHGRFDRQIRLHYPNIKGRASIFKLHLQNLKTEQNKEDLARILSARFSSFATGAEIASLSNEAAIIAARDLSNSVRLEHFTAAADRLHLGMKDKNPIFTSVERKETAYHEAGHAVVRWFLTKVPLLKVSIQAIGSAAGHNWFQPSESMRKKSDIIHEMCEALGGFVAEEVFCGDVSTGVWSDLQSVTDLAYSMVVEYGMSPKIGCVSYKMPKDGVSFQYSNDTARIIDEEVRELVKDAYNTTKSLLLEKKELVEEVVEKLLDKEVLTNEDLLKILGPRPKLVKTKFEEIVEETGSLEEDTSLPKGLQNWNQKKSLELDAQTLDQSMQETPDTD